MRGGAIVGGPLARRNRAGTRTSLQNSGRPAAQAATPMKPILKVSLVVALVGFFVLGSAAFFVACTVSNLRISGGSLHSGVEANRGETHELTLELGQPVRAQVDCGTIHVSSGSSARVVARLRAFGSDKEDAQKRLATMSLELGPNSVAGHEHQDHSLKFFEFGGGEEIDLELTLPEGTRLEVHSGSGDVRIQGGFGDTRAGSDYGDLALSGIRGTLLAKSSSGEIQADEIQGASVRIETSYGDIELRQIQATQLEAHTSSGEIEARALQCERVLLSSDYGDIAVRELKGDLDSKTSSGEVRIADARGACRAHSDYGDVEAEGVFSSLWLSSSSGSIHGRARAGSTLSEGWELASDYGEVALELPAGLSFALDASTDYGEVQTELPGVQVGGGGPKLRLHSSSGDVSIRVR